MDGWPALSFHGDKSQAERDWVLSEFKSGRSPIMTATDVAARGLGRAGAKGTAYTFFTAANARYAKELIAVLKEAGQKINLSWLLWGKGSSSHGCLYFSRRKPATPQPPPMPLLQQSVTPNYHRQPLPTPLSLLRPAPPLVEQDRWCRFEGVIMWAKCMCRVACCWSVQQVLCGVDCGRSRWQFCGLRPSSTVCMHGL